MKAMLHRPARAKGVEGRSKMTERQPENATLEPSATAP
jgi:hypothetical protein